jgi:hypothetical protein
MWTLRALVELGAIIYDGVLAGCEAFLEALDLRGRLACWRRVIREAREIH